MTTHSSILPWRIPMDREAGGLQSIGSQRVRHDRSDLARMHTPLVAPELPGNALEKLIILSQP